MTRFLASVRNPAEVETALGAGADIIDLKDPGKGSLGAVDPETISACVTAVAGRAPVSATIGDLPLEGAATRDAVLATAACGVDYVKLGVFPGGDARGCLRRLESEASRVALILVVFADALPEFDAISIAAKIGAHGVMLDTAEKGTGALLNHMAIDDVSHFVVAAKREGLTVGLAGSLKAADVAPLLARQPDLLGFRGALCRHGARGEALDPIACSRIRALIPAASGVQPKAQIPEPRASALC